MGGKKSGYAGFFNFRFGESIVEQQKASIRGSGGFPGKTP
jgi:hypothetical protein